MTTPNQSIPDVTKSVGLGAYVVDDGGGAQKYGQSGIDSGFVQSFFFGNMAGINVLDLPAAISKVVDYLSSMSLDVLAVLKPLIPGAAIDAWDTVENAVDTIVNALRLDQVLMTFNLFQEWLTSIFGPLVTTVTSVVSDAAAALAKIAALITHAGQAAIEDVGDLIANIWTIISALIAGVSGSSSITDVITTINAATTNIVSLITGVGGSAIADVVTAIGNGVTALTRIGSLISGVSGTVIADVSNAINAATSKFASLISGVSGTTITDVVTAITAATTKLAALISGVSGTVIADVVTAINNGVTALTRIASLISGISGTTITDVVTAINAATTKFASLISGVSGTTITDVVTAIGNGVTALARIASLISGISGTTITDVVTVINAATSKLASLISGISGTTITDVVTVINAATTKLAALISGVSGTVIADVVTAINNGVTALTRIASLISGVSGATVIADVVTAINNGVTALTRLTSLISGIGGTVIADVVTAINAANTNIANLISGLSGSTITDVINAINAATTKLTSLISGVGGSAIADVINAITTALNNAQGMIDNFVNGIFGGTGTGNTTDDVTTAVTSIPHTNVTLPSNSGSGSITHDASTGLTSVTGTTNVLATSGSVTVGSTANYLVARVALNATSTSVTSTVTYGSQKMTLISLRSSASLSGDLVTVAMYGLKNPISGSHTLSVSISVPSGFKVWQLEAQATSLIGVDTVGTLTGTNGSNSSMSWTYSSATGRYVLQAGAVIANTTETLSAYSQTSRYNPGSTLNATANADYLAMIAGDAAGAASVSFTTTCSFTTTNKWVSVAVDFTPLPSTPIGSMMEYSRVSATAVTPSTGGTFTFPNSFFDTQVTLTSDVGYSTTGNTYTAGQDGSYVFAMSVSSGNTTVAGNQRVTPVCFKNGSAYKAGGDAFGTSSGVGAAIIAHMSCPIYLKAGQTCQPGYRTTASANQFRENSSGVDTWWSVTLVNRSLA